MYTLINFIVSIYSVFILICRITFYKKLTKTCKCPVSGWELKYTEYFTYVLIALSIVGLIVNIITRLSTKQVGGASYVNIFGIILMITMLISWGIDVYCIFKLRNKLIEDECMCDIQLREIIYYSACIGLVTFIFMVGLSFGLFFGGTSLNMSEDCSKIKQQYNLATQRLSEELNKRK